MLARSFLSADVLSISEEGRDALIKVLGMLERGEVKHMNISSTMVLGINNYKKLEYFNMEELCAQTACGTVGCILGWARVVADNCSLFSYKRDSNIHNLFHPDVPCWDVISVEQAAQALANYLTTGKADWPAVMAPPH